MHLQARAVGKLVTIPKKMLPMRLQLFKQLLLKGVNPLRPAAAIAVADAPTSGILTVPGIRWVLPGTYRYDCHLHVLHLTEKFFQKRVLCRLSDQECGSQGISGASTATCRCNRDPAEALQAPDQQSASAAAPGGGG